MISKGTIYIGSSAGSVLVCPTIEAIKGIDDPAEAPTLKSYEGLGIIDFLILPHYGDEDYKEQYKFILKKWKNKDYKLKLLTNNQAIIVNGSNYKIVEA
ncbi:Type 1 glutamine amidotransferase-like domain-containing protein [Candidatus Gottesmanbacteria bacterium]|nr:Type 1 glutamine amidotransferase-like domain-containing protein [Candidatus Gottesmanbacteria bacterium]